MTSTAFLPTGIPALDANLGGFLLGDNVLLETDVATPSLPFLRAFLAGAIRRGDGAVYVSFDHSPRTILNRLEGLPGGITILDGFTHGKGRSEPVFTNFYEGQAPEREVVELHYPGRPNYFHSEFDALASGAERMFIVVDSLTGMQELWGTEQQVRAFYTHTCPRLFDTRAVAVWTLAKRVHSDGFLAAIGNIAQVVVELQRTVESPTFTVRRAAERPEAAIERPVAYAVKAGELVVHAGRPVDANR